MLCRFLGLRLAGLVAALNYFIGNSCTGSTGLDVFEFDGTTPTSIRQKVDTKKKLTHEFAGWGGSPRVFERNNGRPTTMIIGQLGGMVPERES